MSDEQLHSLDEQELVAGWKEDGKILSPEDQEIALNNLADVNQIADQNVETFMKLPPQTNEATGAERRAELRQQIADEEAQQ